MDYKIIAVDFDGTLCENKFPEIGEANKEMIKYLKDRQETSLFCGLAVLARFWKML